MLKTYLSSITALNSEGTVQTWPGPKVQANSFEEAQSKLSNHGMGYCVVRSEVMYEDPEADSSDSLLQLIVGIKTHKLLPDT